jgi:Tfp pilus assembly protein PilO
MKFDFNKILEQFNKLDLKIRYAIFGGIFLLIFLLDIFTLMGFQMGNIQKIDADKLTMQQSIDQLKADLKRVDQMKASLQNSRSQLESLNAKIRSVNEVSSLLEDISRIANEAGIKIEQLNPQTDPPQLLLSSGTVKYYSLSIVIQATSSYHVLGHFINQLESANLFFTLTNLMIEDRGSEGSNRHNISATLKFVLSDKTAGDVK